MSIEASYTPIYFKLGTTLVYKPKAKLSTHGKKVVNPGTDSSYL